MWSNFVSSNIAFTNRLEMAMLYLYNGQLSEHCGALKSFISPIEQTIASRAVASLTSLVAAVDLVFHTVLLSSSLLFAAAKRVYIGVWEVELCKEHLQRIRDAAFPLLFGSIFGLIHPYLGVYAQEPVKKHIATALLLSNTTKESFDVVCSPLTMMQEVATLMTDVEEAKELAPMLKQVSYWESEFEKIQSIDFFNLQLTDQFFKAIDDLQVSSLVKRISLIVAPIFMGLDLLVFTGTTLVSFGSLFIKAIGCQSAAYLEMASSCQVLLSSIVKIALFCIGSSIGMVVALGNPQKGLAAARYPLNTMTHLLFKYKVSQLKQALRSMHNGERFLLPAVETYPYGERLKYLPTFSNHMCYLLVERKNDEFQLELIERSERHGKSKKLTFEACFKLIEETLAMRYRFSDSNPLDKYEIKEGLTNLGIQTGVNNCVCTNLFAAFQLVLGHDRFGEFCKKIKGEAVRRYQMYRFDYYPFGENAKVIAEIDHLASAVI